MKISEFKIKTLNGINKLIDTYFSGTDIKDKFINATLKIFVKQNINKYDNILSMFADENGEIIVADILEEYSKVFGDDGFVFDIRDYVKNDMIRSLLPNKALIIKKEDFMDIYKINTRELNTRELNTRELNTKVLNTKEITNPKSIIKDLQNDI